MFITMALCLAGVYAALKMPSSVFPQTDFPRCVILIDNGVMPAEEMMATITRPVEEVMKDIPGAAFVRSATGRGSAEVNVFFNWQVDMIQSELSGNSHHGRTSADVFGVSNHWRKPHQRDAQHHQALGNRPLSHQTKVSAGTR